MTDRRQTTDDGGQTGNRELTTGNSYSATEVTESLPPRRRGTQRYGNRRSTQRGLARARPQPEEVLTQRHEEHKGKTVSRGLLTS